MLTLSLFKSEEQTVDMFVDGELIGTIGADIRKELTSVNLTNFSEPLRYAGMDAFAFYHKGEYMGCFLVILKKGRIRIRFDASQKVKILRRGLVLKGE